MRFSAIEKAIALFTIIFILKVSFSRFSLFDCKFLIVEGAEEVETLFAR